MCLVLQTRISKALVNWLSCQSIVLWKSQYGTYRKTQKSKLIQKFSFQPVDLQEPYIALIDMVKIIRHNPYEWSDYVPKVSSIIFRHNNATRIICVNDPYDTAYSTKDDKRDLRVQGRAHVPNICMKFNDPFPSARAFKTSPVAPATREANMQTP